MIIKDYYKILEFNSNRVSLDQIKAAYKNLAKKYHPDLNVGNTRAEERFKDIAEAYRVLTDITGRKKYDRMWNSYIGSKKAYRAPEKEETEENPNNTFFSILFGNTNTEKTQVKHKKNSAKGENVETEIRISIEEAYRGTEKKIGLKDIDGTAKTIMVKIPEGIKNKEKIKIIAQGKKGKNGGKNGDLFIKINIQDSKQFKLNGQDVITNLSLTPWEAALGTKVNVDGLEEIISIHIPQGIQSNEEIILEQKGYKNESGQRGKLIIKIQIVVPKTLTTEEKELFQQLKNISKFRPRTSRSK